MAVNLSPPINLSSLAPLTTGATALSNLILVSPQATIGYQPQNLSAQNASPKQQPPALLFHYEGEQTATLTSDITDHYVEDNTAIQDQIAIKPTEVTTHGFIGELNDVAPQGLDLIQQAAQKLTVVSAYTPVLSATAILAYDEAFQLYQVANNAINSAVSTWSSITGSGGESVITGQDGFPIAQEPNQNQQQTYFQQFYGYYAARTLFTIQTPWAVFQNMAIKSLRAIQSAETNVITDFEITFKQMRFASTNNSQGDINQLLGYAAAQASTVSNNGATTPPSSLSLDQGLSANYPSSFSGVA